MSCVFDDIIEPSLERIPVLEAVHSERHNGRGFSITQTVRQNVFTEFDRKLSRHLAATRGTGFPAFTVSVEVADAQIKDKPYRLASARLASAHHCSVPHALKEIAARAYAHGDGGPVDLTLHRGNRNAAEGVAAGSRRVIDADDIEMLDRALGICRHLGEAEFLDISGDFDIVFASPPGGQEPMTLHLQNGTVSISCVQGISDTPFECPIFAFAEYASRDRAAQGYLASARHALVAEKEAAILAFRSAAERRILDFDRALAGHPLQGHRLDAAVGLVARLTAGLGETLSGLSEDARITALDWSTAIERAGSESPDGVGSSFALVAGAAARRAG